MAEPLTFGVAFSAGLVSFLSPCVLPLFPSYVSFVTGMSVDRLSAELQMAERVRGPQPRDVIRLRLMADRFLVMEHGQVIRFRRQRRIRKFIQSDEVILEPLPVRMLHRDLALQFFVVNDPTCIRIYKEHAAGL